ncbi:MAG: hypothetical protein QM681_11920 [Novosphingobium sp.]
MDANEIAKIRAQAQAVLDRIDNAHTPANFDRLKAELTKRGMQLSGTMRRKTAFTVTDRNGSKVTGLSLASVEDLLTKLRGDQA